MVYFKVFMWQTHPNLSLFSRVVSDLMEEAKSQKRNVAQDDGMKEIFIKILENPALDVRDKKAAIIDFITAGIETVRTDA